jgi:hypothetical protein
MVLLALTQAIVLVLAELVAQEMLGMAGALVFQYYLWVLLQNLSIMEIVELPVEQGAKNLTLFLAAVLAAEVAQVVLENHLAMAQLVLQVLQAPQVMMDMYVLCGNK